MLQSGQKQAGLGQVRVKGEDFGLEDGNEVRHWSKPVQNSKQSGLLAELIDCFKLKGTAGV